MKNLNILPLEPRDIPRSKAKCLDFSQCPTYNRCKVINLIHNRHFDLFTLQNNTKCTNMVVRNPNMAASARAVCSMHNKALAEVTNIYFRTITHFAVNCEILINDLDLRSRFHK